MAKKSKVRKVAETVTDAVTTVAKEYVLQPVSKALGLKRKKAQPQRKSARKATRKAAVARATRSSRSKPARSR
jgi:hypothetical protein